MSPAPQMGPGKQPDLDLAGLPTRRLLRFRSLRRPDRSAVNGADRKKMDWKQEDIA